MLISSERANVEHALADLKTWRILTRLRGGYRHATTLLRALMILTQTEIARQQTTRQTITSKII